MFYQNYLIQFRQLFHILYNKPNSGYIYPNLIMLLTTYYSISKNKLVKNSGNFTPCKWDD